MLRMRADLGVGGLKYKQKKGDSTLGFGAVLEVTLSKDSTGDGVRHRDRVMVVRW